MAKIIGTHKDGGMAAACQGKMQITVTTWDCEPTREQLEQYPSSEWCKDRPGKRSDEDVYGYDGSDEPVKSVPSQTSGIDKIITFVSVVGGILACLFLLGLARL